MEKDFGEYFKNLREQCGLNRSELAKKANLNPATITLIEQGKRRPHPDTLQQLAPHLGVSYSRLMIAIGYLAIDDALYIEDPRTKQLFAKLTEGKKQLLESLDGVAESNIIGLANFCKSIKNQS